MMTTQTTSTKAPSHIAYTVKENAGAEKPIWLKVGAAWEHADREGFNLKLNLLEQEIILTIRRNKPKAPDATPA